MKYVVVITHQLYYLNVTILDTERKQNELLPNHFCSNLSKFNQKKTDKEIFGREFHNSEQKCLIERRYKSELILFTPWGILISSVYQDTTLICFRFSCVLKKRATFVQKNLDVNFTNINWLFRKINQHDNSFKGRTPGDRNCDLVQLQNYH